MSFWASIEADTGDYLRLLHTNGQHGGNALLSLLVPLDGHCSESYDPAIVAWCEHIERHTGTSFCALVAPLAAAWYTSGGGRTEDYDDAFRESIERRWGDVEQLRATTELLIQVLTYAEPQATWWYDPDWTLRDLRGLVQAFTIIVERGVRRARIDFT